MGPLSRCVAILALLAACESRNCPECPTTGGGDQAAPTSATPTKIASSNECILGDDALFVHVLLPIRYSEPKGSESRQLYQFDCNRSSKECSGVQMNLDGVDSGKPVTPLALGPAIGAEVVSTAGSVATIQWGLLRTFTVDLAEGTVKYVESGPGVEGRSEARCTTRDVRKCSDESGCLPAWKCYEGRCIPR